MRGWYPLSTGAFVVMTRVAVNLSPSGQQWDLDSGWVFDATRDYSRPGAHPIRWLAEGRDPSATIDSTTRTDNDGDNEITGVHVSDGDPTEGGLLGAKIPELNNPKWRWFCTQQHGDNAT